VSARGLFITGTDTGVGKTVITNEDALALMEASNVALPYARVNPFCFEPAISPHIAAKEANVAIDKAKIAAEYTAIAALSDRVIVEGAGGWLAPIGETETMADLARALGLPALLVVALRLGCLNHAALTRRAIEAARVPFAGWIANAPGASMEREAENLATLTASLGGPPLALVRFAPGSARTLVLAQAAAQLAAGA
jgi:dethiobiotin synthetase